MGGTLYRKTLEPASDTTSGEPVILTVETHGEFTFVLINDFAENGELILDGARNAHKMVERGVDMAIWPVEKLISRGKEIAKLLGLS